MHKWFVDWIFYARILNHVRFLLIFYLQILLLIHFTFFFTIIWSLYKSGLQMQIGFSWIFCIFSEQCEKTNGNTFQLRDKYKTFCKLNKAFQSFVVLYIFWVVATYVRKIPLKNRKGMKCNSLLLKHLCFEDIENTFPS